MATPEAAPVSEEPKAEPKPLTSRDKWNLARVRSWVARLCLLLAVLAIATPAEARIFGRRSRGGSSYGSVPAGCSNATAQGVAEIQAKLGRVGHFGGNRGYEGCGSGSSPQAALNNCCYSRSGMKVVDSGTCKGRNGMWYACKRYGR